MISYDEGADAYHANPAIGSSDIRAFMRSPILFKKQRDGKWPKETPAMLFGTASHMSMLEPERFQKTYVIKPAGTRANTIAGSAWHAKVDALGMKPIAADDAAALMEMHATMPPEIDAILKRSKAEVTFRTSIASGVEVQCRIDALDGVQPYDLKTIKAIETIDGAIHRLGYHIQANWYERVMEAETGTAPAPLRFIFVENAPPYRWRLVDLDSDYRAIASKAVDDALAELAARMKSGAWVDRDDLHYLASPPDWMNDATFDGEE